MYIGKRKVVSYDLKPVYSYVNYIIFAISLEGRFFLFCCVDEGSEAVVVGALWIVKIYFTCFFELKAFDIEFIEEFRVEGHESQDYGI